MDDVDARIAADLAAHLGEPVTAVRHIPEGHSGFSYWVDLDGRRGVMRLPPPGARIAGSADIPRQGRLMDALHRAGLPVPAVVAMSDQPVVDGRPTHFYEWQPAGRVILGFAALILPGIWLFVRWYFAPQAVVVDGRRSLGALERSAELVSGSWWRVLGVLIIATIAVAVPGALIQVPFNAWARSADSSALSLVGQVVASALTAPFEALMLTLLYFDLLARRSLPAMVPPVQPPPV